MDGHCLKLRMKGQAVTALETEARAEVGAESEGDIEIGATSTRERKREAESSVAFVSFEQLIEFCCRNCKHLITN